MYLYRPGLALATHSIAFFLGVYTSPSVKTVIQNAQNSITNTKTKLSKKIEKVRSESKKSQIERYT